MEKSKELAKIDSQFLKDNVSVGFKGVDPTDISPPSLILIQKTSNLDEFIDKEGNTPRVGQLFHTGKLKIYDSVDCYILYAAKKKYIDRSPGKEPSEMDQYVAFALLKDSLSLFGIRFRKTALNALSPLFTAVLSQQVPMFAFNVKIESKEIQGDLGTWHVPAVRVGEIEQDQDTLNKLYQAALKLDKNAEAYIAEKEDDEASAPKDPFVEELEIEKTGKVGKDAEEKEDEIDLDDIPF